MESKEPTVFTSTYAEGMKRVLKGNFAFLCESSMLDYVVQRDCNLTQIGGLVDSKGYGIATPKGSQWKDRISKAILYLQEKSSIQVAYNISRSVCAIESRKLSWAVFVLCTFWTLVELQMVYGTIKKSTRVKKEFSFLGAQDLPSWYDNSSLKRQYFINNWYFIPKQTTSTNLFYSLFLIRIKV